MAARVKQVMLALAQFVVLIHGPYYLQTPLAIAAPRLDRKLWQDLVSYEALYPARRSNQYKIASAAKLSLSRHLLYLSEQNVVFGIFDRDLSNAERQAMATKLANTPKPLQWTTGKPELRVNHLETNPHTCLSVFVGPKSWLLFKKLEMIDDSWLRQPVDTWANNQSYRDAWLFVKYLKVTNDTAERCIGHVTRYRNTAKDSQYNEDTLLVAGDHRGVLQDLRRQAQRRLN